MQTYKIERTGEAPLRFTGELIGSGSTEIYQGQRANRWTTVDLYHTKGRKFVAVVTNHTIWQGEHDYTKARAFDTPAEVIKFLQEDCEDGRLGRASQEACAKAAVNLPAFAEAYQETVD